MDSRLGAMKKRDRGSGEPRAGEREGKITELKRPPVEEKSRKAQKNSDEGEDSMAGDEGAGDEGTGDEGAGDEGAGDEGADDLEECREGGEPRGEDAVEGEASRGSQRWVGGAR
jgi:hypothetical protein